MLLNITILEDETAYAGQLQKLLAEWSKKITSPSPYGTLAVGKTL